MKYKFKMILPAIGFAVGSTILLLASLFCTKVLTAAICFIMGIILYMPAVHFPHRLFRIRLNDYFVIIRYPCTKWQGVYQLPKKNTYKLGPNRCPRKLRDLSRQMTRMFSSAYFSTGAFYHMTTHQAIINRLLRLKEKGMVKILACQQIGQYSLKKEQQKILGSSCRCCSDRKVCRWHQEAVKNRQFYYIEFQVLR